MIHAEDIDFFTGLEAVSFCQTGKKDSISCIVNFIYPGKRKWIADQGTLTILFDQLKILELESGLYSMEFHVQLKTSRRIQKKLPIDFFAEISILSRLPEAIKKALSSIKPLSNNYEWSVKKWYLMGGTRLLAVAKIANAARIGGEIL